MSNKSETNGKPKNPPKPKSAPPTKPSISKGDWVKK